MTLGFSDYPPCSQPTSWTLQWKWSLSLEQRIANADAWVWGGAGGTTKERSLPPGSLGTPRVRLGGQLLSAPTHAGFR